MSLFASCVRPLQGFKVGYIVFHYSSSLTAAKSHPHDEPLVVSTEQHPVNTGVQSEWHRSGSFTFITVCLFFKLICVGLHSAYKQEVHVEWTNETLIFSWYTLHCILPEWTQKYRESIIQPAKLQQIVDSFMADYDKRKEEVRIFCQRGINTSLECLLC